MIFGINFTKLKCDMGEGGKRRNTAGAPYRDLKDLFYLSVSVSALALQNKGTIILLLNSSNVPTNHVVITSLIRQ